MTESEILDIRVAGQQFSVTPTAGVPGQYDFDWISAPHRPYGFTIRVSRGGSLTREQMLEYIEGFLSNIDPQTGYTAEDPEERN